MLDPKLVDEIRVLLNAGHLSQRKIADKVGVSRGTVLTIAKGRWRGPLRRPKKNDAVETQPKGAPERCPGCGGLVYLPCQVCRARKINDARKKPPPETD
jgi:DNA-binding XRE family transcriptional regulator